MARRGPINDFKSSETIIRLAVILYIWFLLSLWNVINKKRAVTLAE